MNQDVFLLSLASHGDRIFLKSLGARVTDLPNSRTQQAVLFNSVLFLTIFSFSVNYCFSVIYFSTPPGGHA
jgi:hypothetical protein